MREADSVDQARLTRLTMWLLAGTTPPVNSICALLRGQDGRAWLRRVSALCLHCLRRLGRSGGEGALVDAAWLMRLCSADAHGGNAVMTGTIQSMLVQVRTRPSQEIQSAVCGTPYGPPPPRFPRKQSCI